MNIPFNKPHLTGNELKYIQNSHAGSQLAGDGPYTKLCSEWLERESSTRKALLTHSCTASLEMAALLLEVAIGDEIIMPSYTFVSTANAFALRGATPVFVDIRPDTLNIDEKLIEAAISSKTKAIVVVHYAGVSCEMDAILEIAKRHGIAVVEDAAQGIMATYKQRALGSIGDLGAYSFHETKNVISGEGGALLVNQQRWVEQAEIVREKGTDRSKFFRGQTDKYTWQAVGGSFLPGEITAAFLWAQLEHAKEITEERIKVWNFYHELFDKMEEVGKCRRPVVPKECGHNAHMYYLLLEDGVNRSEVLSLLAARGVNAVFHYVPLHSSPAGLQLGKTSGELVHTNTLAGRLIRLPLWVGITELQQEYVYQSLANILE